MKNVIKSLEYMTIGTSLHDRDGNIIYVNPVFCKIFQSQKNTLIDNKLSYDLINVNIESNYNVFDFINNNISNINNLIIKVNYNNYFNIIRINTLMIKNGIDYYILTYDDITNDANHSFLYDEIFNNIKSGIILCYQKNNDFYIKDINPHFEFLYDYKKSELINKKLDSLNLPTFKNTTLNSIIYNVWKTGIKYEVNNSDCTDDNYPCWRNIYIQKTITSDIIIMFDDITEIIESKKKIEVHNKHKTNFLSNMSHEIRSPINSIIGFADILDFDSKNKNKQKEYVDIIKNSSKMLYQLVNDILDTSKIEEGIININKDHFNVKKVINEIYMTTENNNKNDKVKIIKNCSNKKVDLLNDEYRFRQIITNLVNNAIKFTKKGYIEIGYKIVNKNLLVYVKDTGIGIKDDDKYKIFERFQKLQNNSKIGSGLGLSISNELAKLMGGKLWFESTYDKGSTFYLELPLEFKRNNNTNNNTKINIQGDINLEGKNILIVEDIEFNAKLLLSYLEDTNANIIISEEGNDALLKYNDNKDNLDLILMDIKIPNIEGTEVTQIIRTIDKTTPIVAQTAHALKEEIDNIMEYGFNDIIKKPIKKSELFEIINKYINLD